MPDYNYSIFKLIRDKNGLETLRIARNFERETLAITRFKNLLNFNHRLKENRIIPKRLRFNPPIKYKEGYDIAKKADLAYLRLRINNCHIQIRKRCRKVERLRSDLKQSLDEHSMTTLTSTVEHKATVESEHMVSIHQDELQRLLYNLPDNRSDNRSVNHGNDPTERWVVNISNKPLSDLDKTALGYGFNFLITPTKLPIAEILSSVESGIKHLPPASANLIRAKTVPILKGSKPSRQSNIKKDQLGTLKALSKDPSVTILPADKGRAVVVMDSSDYQQKIYGLLQDGNTLTQRFQTSAKIPRRAQKNL